MPVVSGLLADFLSYVKDNLILIVLCVVCIAAIVAIIVILSVSAKHAKSAAELTAEAPEDALPESLQEAEEATTHDVPVPVPEPAPADNAAPAETVTETEESEPAPQPTEVPAATEETTSFTTEETTEKAEDAELVVQPIAEEKAKLPPKRKIVVTTRRQEKKTEEAKPTEPAPQEIPAKETEPEAEKETIEVIAPPETKETDEIVVVEPPVVAEANETIEATETTETSEKSEDPEVTEPVPDEKKADKETPVPVSDSDEKKNTDKKTQYTGKWGFTQVVTKDEAGEIKESDFFFSLKASNGETLISSEEYTSLRGASQGIDTFKANIAKNNFKIAVSKKGKYVIKLLTAQGSLLAQGAHYNNRAAAQSGVASIRRFAKTAVKQDEVQILELPYEDVPVAENKDYDPSKKGKWVLRKAVAEDGNEESYYFELRASNGQLLLTSEEYTTLNGAKSGIATHKANIASGNIRPVLTRNGDYILKIYAGNGQLLCLGEHYATKELCQSAVDSVKRFAETAESVEENSDHPEEI